MILICYFANSTFPVNLQNNKHRSQALLESLRSFLPLSTEKPLIIFKYAFQKPRSKGSRREPWERGWSFSYTKLAWATIGIVVQGSQIVEDVAKIKNKLRENETRGFSYPFPRSLLKAWAVSFLKVRVSFWSLNQTVKPREESRCLTVNEISEVPSQQNSVTSPRYAVTFARNGSLEQSTIGST